MPRTLPTGVAALVTSAAVGARFAVEIGFPTPLRLTNADGGVTIATFAFAEASLAVASSPIDPEAMVSITIPNALNEVSTPVLTAGGIRGITCKVWEVERNSATGVQVGEVVWFDGVCVAVTFGGAVAQITARLRSAAASGMVGRYIGRACPYRFSETSLRGTEREGVACGYAGVGTWCDHSFARCTALANTARFGGARLAPVRGSIFTWILAELAPQISRVEKTEIVTVQAPPHIAVENGPPRPIPGWGGA